MQRLVRLISIVLLTYALGAASGQAAPQRADSPRAQPASAAGAAPRSAQVAESRAFLPFVAQQGGATLTTLDSRDTGFVSAVVVPGTTRVLLGWIVRPGGNLLHIGEDVGDHIVEVEEPALRQLVLANMPSFVFPGPKQGAACLVVVGDRLLIYATSRDEGDPNGSFRLKRLSMPVPPAPQ